jgi:methionine synthase I (cobalamin-dependent)
VTITLLETLLQERDWLLADGATGTNLFAMGLQAGDPPDFWNIEHPERVLNLHRSFIEAGSDIILTNTFGGTSYRLKLHNAQDRVFELNKAGAELACQAAAESGRKIVVAGDIGPTGELFEPLGTMTYADAVAAFKAQAEGLKAGGADIAWIETMSAEEEVQAAIEGAAAAGLKAVTTMSFDTAGRSMMGVTPTRFAQFALELESYPIAFGANCGVGTSELVASVLGLSAGANGHDHCTRTSGIIVAKGNCGMPQFKEGEISYNGTAEEMARYACMAYDAGARIIGGCCGTLPEHLKAMRVALEAHVKGDAPTISDIEEKLGEVSDLAKGLGTKSTGDRQARRRR